MTGNINGASLANLKHYEGKWNHGRTRTIRVPIALADRVLTLARQLDNNESLDTSAMPDAATLLNRLKAKRKKSKCDLADVEAILDILGGDFR
ncbi:flagellar alpha dynein [Microcoleus sp. F6_B6]